MPSHRCRRQAAKHVTSFVNDTKIKWSSRLRETLIWE